MKYETIKRYCGLLRRKFKLIITFFLVDDFRHLMGTETIRIGTSRMFDMFQHQTLNKRFVYVFLEGVIITLFPQNKFQELFTRLHSQSERVANHLAKMKESTDNAESGARKRRR